MTSASASNTIPFSPVTQKQIAQPPRPSDNALGTGARSGARRPALAGLAVALLASLLLLCIAIRLSNYELRRDEELYVPPAQLLANYDLYRDFFYNHTPGSAWLFRAITQLTGSDYLLLNARLGVLAGWLLLAGSIGAISFVLTRSVLASSCIVILSLANELLLAQTGMSATNNFLPLPFSFLGLGLFILGVNKGYARPLMLALAGVCLSAGVVLKLSAVAFIVPVAIAAFLLPRQIGIRLRLTQVVAPLLAGGLVGALPIFWYLISDPARFLANVVGYHLGPHLQYFATPGASDENAAVSLGAKLALAYDVWLGGAVAVSLAALLTLVLMVRRWSADLDSARWLVPSAPVAIVLAAFASSAVFSFVPTPGFPQYFAPPLVVCLPLGLALLFARLAPEARPKVLPALVAAATVLLLVAAPRLLQHVGSIVRPQNWTVARVHTSGVDMAKRLAAAGVHGKVATLAPVYPLEGGLDVYLELATGPFAYRIADMTAPELARYYKMTSPTKITSLLDADPPAALLLGYYPALEEPMLAYARSNGYVAVPDFAIVDRYGTGTLYVRSQQPD